MTTDLAYRLINVSRSYEGSPQPAVDEASLDIARGQFFGLLGRNGAGKSTLVKMMVGLLAPDRGEVHVLGRRLRRDDFAHLGRVGYMPQSAFALNNLTVRRAIFTVAHMRGKTWRQARTKRDELVTTLDLTAVAGKVAHALGRPASTPPTSSDAGRRSRRPAPR